MTIPNNLQAGGDDTGWLAIFGKVAPILGGIGAVGSLINSIISAQQTAAFQEQLISSLQAMEQTLEGIKNDLDAIYQELKNIEQDIVGLGLNDKVTAIDTWSMELAALVPTDKHGAQKLATSMMKASQGASSLLGCMIGIHNAMVGEGIGTPLITLMDGPSFVRLRARLVRGLQLLAFGTAFNTAETYEYGVFLLQWSINFRQQTDMYFAAGKDNMAINLGHFDQDPPEDMSVCDCIGLYQYAQPQLPNIATAVIRPGYGPIVLSSGTLFSEIFKGYGWFVLGYDPNEANDVIYFIDLASNQFTTDMNSPLANECESQSDPSRYNIFYSSVITIVSNSTPQYTLVCGARYKEDQTFLGAAAGQMHWLEATGDRSSLVSSIYDGDTTDAELVTYNKDLKEATTTLFAGLSTLSNALWTTSWEAGNAITIVLSANAGDPIYLGIDADGNWRVSSEQQAFGVMGSPDPVPGTMQNPLQMPPTSVTLKSSMGGQKSVLFRQF
jgi:hypothetical protein